MSRYWRDLMAWWASLSRREQRGVQLAMLALAGGVFWLALLAPAWRTLDKGPAQRQALSAQLSELRQLQKEAQALKALPVPSREDALQKITAQLRQLDTTAKLDIAGDRASASVSKVDPAALGAWLAQRGNFAGIAPAEIRLNRQAAAGGPEAAALWSGQLTYLLPSASGTP